MLDVKVMGMGCSKCNKLEEMARAALAQSGQQGAVTKVMDPAAFAEAGVMHTPALVLNGEVKSAGRLPTREQLAEWFSAAA